MVVSAASGAVGAVVGQIAKIKGGRVVGVAGAQKKCDYVRRELRFDGCVSHLSENLGDDLNTACPQGIDVYFENVGGKVFEAVLPLLKIWPRASALLLRTGGSVPPPSIALEIGRRSPLES